MEFPIMGKVVCGRKFCSVCKRWRHTVDFQVRTWWDDPICNYPRTLTSMCRNCNSTVSRIKKGQERLVRTGTGNARKGESGYERRLAQNRASAARRRQDPEYARRERSYQRRWRAKQAAKAGRVFKPKPSPKYVDEVIEEGWFDENPMVRAEPFLEWYNSQNGKRSNLDHYLKNVILHAERHGRIRLYAISDICIALDANEWTNELMEACEAATGDQVEI